MPEADTVVRWPPDTSVRLPVAANPSCSSAPSPICRLRTLISGWGSDTLALQSYDISALRLQVKMIEALL